MSKIKHNQSTQNPAPAEPPAPPQTIGTANPYH